MGFTGSGLTLQLEVTFASGSTVNIHKGKVIEIQTAIARCSERKRVFCWRHWPRGHNWGPSIIFLLIGAALSFLASWYFEGHPGELRRSTGTNVDESAVARRG
jgi:hypothetical protein